MATTQSYATRKAKKEGMIFLVYKITSVKNAPARGKYRI